MNRYLLIRGLRWPVIVLLIGVLALLHQFGIVPHFWRLFWPLLLITFGLQLLAERAALAEEGYPDTPWPTAAYPGAVNQTVPQPAEAAGTAMVSANSLDLTGPSNGGQG
jgi:hypothetical protein